MSEAHSNVYRLKRPSDFLSALIGIVLSSPLWLIISLAIYAEDRGPIFFLQERCGKGDTRFHMIKFRTMKPLQKGEAHEISHLEKDPRVTRTGRVLRTTAMDELPNLINIVKGDMSFVGPKPLPFKVGVGHRRDYDNITQVPGYELRSQVRPGLTGVAQIYGAKSTRHEERFQLDAEYIEKMSFWLDLKLIFISFWVTFKGRWEQKEKKL